MGIETSRSTGSSAFADDDERNCGTSVARSHLRPAAFDDLGRALAEQFEPDRTAEFAWPVRRPGTRSFDEQVARFIQHGGGQRHLLALNGRESRDRRVAMAVEDAQHLAAGSRAFLGALSTEPRA